MSWPIALLCGWIVLHIVDRRVSDQIKAASPNLPRNTDDDGNS
jgi:hypothetical protein